MKLPSAVNDTNIWLRPHRQGFLVTSHLFLWRTYPPRSVKHLNVLREVDWIHSCITAITVEVNKYISNRFSIAIIIYSYACSGRVWLLALPVHFFLQILWEAMTHCPSLSLTLSTFLYSDGTAILSKVLSSEKEIGFAKNRCLFSV